jgi:CheY-like chemotaxis protein/anti-sigma regulatory factor (Ser/Thr protein kinase)
MTILSIVNDILDISKIESGKFELYPARYDAPSLINDVITQNVVRIGEKPITFSLFVDENLPGAMLGDDLRVKQIFSNLLSNAFKYTESGAVEWRIGFEREGGEIWLVSSVKDTGIGMKPESVEKLFSEYDQVDAAANRKVEGTGLGLAIARNLAEMMGGTVTVESEYGKGTAFSVRLRQGFVSEKPIGREAAENLMSLRYSLAKRDTGARLKRADLSYAHVLVVDDIATNLDVVRGMMKPYGIKLDCAVSGRQAIERIAAESPRYDAVFMDHMMPEMDGVEAARAIREEIGTEYAKNVPIIALTANAIVGNEEMFLSNGFQDFISKPIDMARLDSVLRRWVKDKNRKEMPGGETPAGPEAALLLGANASRFDIAKALGRFSGDGAALADVLRSYASGTRGLLAKLKRLLEAKDLTGYAIDVHGVKGSSYAICAEETGKAAEALEAAAKAGNLAAVRAGHDAFAQTAQALLAEIEGLLEKLGAVSEKPLSDAPDPALLEELKAACASFDMDSVDAAMQRLEAFRYGRGGELVAWLREKVDSMEFEEIAARTLTP